LREVIAGTRLAHPNLATAYNANDENGVLYYAMEYINGPDIESWLEKHGPLPIAYGIALMIQAASALQFLHQHGMVHRDIKPANLLLVGADLATGTLPDCVDPDAVLVKVIDFGLARLHPRGTPNSGTIRQEAELVGTPRFIAPEQATDFHDVDVRSDLYSLGCTFYRALTGQYPFDADSTMQIIRLHLQEQAKPLNYCRSDIPPGLVSVIQRLMAKKPAERFQTPNELIAALHQVTNSMVYAAVNPTPTTAPRATSSTKTQQARSRPLIEQLTEPPSTTPTNLDNEQLTIRWHEWQAILNACLAQQQPRISNSTYEELHRSLVQTFIARQTDPENGVRYARLASIIQPWVTPRSLTNLDRTTLRNVAVQCADASALWQVIPPRQDWKRRMAYGLLVLTLCGLCYWAITSPLIQEKWGNTGAWPKWLRTR
jgi:serine/threonine protein kinase